jgi:hypothetical protein
MVLQVHKIRGLDRSEIFLNGGLFGGYLKNGVYGLDGKTLILDSPQVANPTPPPPTLPQTMTFSAPAGFLSFQDIITQITAGFTGVHAKGKRGELVIIEDTPTDGITVDKDGTANSLLGFSSYANTVGTVYAAPSGAAPKLVKMGLTALSDGSYVMILDV